MVQIRQYTRQRMPRELIRSQASAADFGGNQSGLMALASAQGEVSDSLNQLSASVKDVKQRRDKSEYIRKLSEFQLENMQKEKELVEQEYDPEINLGATFANDLQQRAEAFMGDVPAHLRDQWAQDLSRMQTKFAKTGMEEQIKREGIRQETNFNNSVSNYQNMLARGAISLEQYKENVKVAVDATGLIKEQRESLFNEQVSAGLGVKANSLISENPYKFKAGVNAGLYDQLPNLQNYILKADSQIEKIEKKAAFASDKANLILDAATGRMPLDPKNRDHMRALDEHYLSYGADINSGLADGDVASANIATQFVKTYGVVPESMQGTVRGLMNAGDSDQKIFAYNLISEFDDVGANGFTEQEKKDAVDFTTMVSAGFEPKIAAENLSMLNDPNFKPVKDLRSSQVSGLINAEKAESQINKVFDSFFEISGPDIIPSDVVAMYQEAFENHYVLTGSEASAQKAAANTVARNFSVTSIMGPETVTRFAPENYGHPSLSPSENRQWMREDLKKSLTDLGESDYLADYQLSPIFENKDRVEAGLPPAYYIVKESDFVRDEDGRALKFYFDMDSGYQIFAEKNAKRQEAISRAVQDERAVKQLMLDPNLSELEKAAIKSAATLNRAKVGLQAIKDGVAGIGREKRQEVGDYFGDKIESAKDFVSTILVGEE